MSLSTLLVDARPVDHPTARQRGIGRWVTGLLTGLRDIDAPVLALYGTDAEADILAETIPGLESARWSPQVVRDHAVEPQGLGSGQFALKRLDGAGPEFRDG